jgi:hypothetical protein
MSGDYFFQCVESLAAALDDDEEETLEAYQEKISRVPVAKRRAVRRELVAIIGGLSRLEMRLKESDGR